MLRTVKMLSIIGFTLIVLQNVRGAWVETNLVKNGDFSADPLKNGWTLLQKGNYHWAAGEKGSQGQPSPGVTLSAFTQGYTDKDRPSKPAVLVQEVTGLKPNTHYKLSVDTDFYGSAEIGGGIKVKLQVCAPESELDTVPLYQVARAGGNGWKTISVEFTTGDETSVQIRLRSAEYWWEPEAYFDNVKLSEETADTSKP